VPRSLAALPLLTDPACSNLSTEEDAAILGGYGDDDEAR
jgi:hypothetical protein